ncbi:nucleotide-diphospho-sugar transferase-domain-containing protein [Pilobolus umbonatus]|nr:nucleotide-diphospho-sugar transferase-domain-containing protein [Pilobolus umbonatus]
MEKYGRNKAFIMLLVSIFLISLLLLISNLVPSRSRFLDVHSTDVLDEPEPEDLVAVDTEFTKVNDWTPKPWGKLSKEIEQMIDINVRKEKKDRILLTAVTNSGMGDYTLNWIASLKKCGLDDKFLVFATDKAMVDTMHSKGYGKNVVLIPEDWFHQELTSEFGAWLTTGYTPITQAKSLVVERLLYSNVTVWFSDVDIVFTSPSIYSYLTMKLTSRKSLTETLFSQETEQDIVNSGFYVMRPTITNKHILAASIEIQDKEPKVTQQRAINRILNDMDLSYHSSKIALLDLMLFPHGRMYFDRNIPTKYDMTPMIVHANYRVGENKMKDLKKFGLWYLD